MRDARCQAAGRCRVLMLQMRAIAGARRSARLGGDPRADADHPRHRGPDARRRERRGDRRAIPVPARALRASGTCSGSSSPSARPSSSASTPRRRTSRGAASSSAVASRRRYSRASGCSTPSSVEHADHDAADVVLAGRSAARDRVDQRSSAALGLARVERARTPRRASTAVRPSRRIRAARPSAWKRSRTLLERARAPRRSRRARAASGQRDGGVGPAGLELERAAQRRLVARGASSSASLGHEASKKRSTAAGWLRADELVDDPAVLERLDRRDALDLERAARCWFASVSSLASTTSPSRRGGRLLEPGAELRHGRTTRPRSRRRPGSSSSARGPRARSPASVTSMTCHARV